MRYYIYMDKDFLKTLFSVIDTSDFNIEIMEYSLKKSITSNDGMSLSPCIEMGNINERNHKCDNNMYKNSKNICNINKKESLNKKKIGIAVDKNNIYNVERQIKYINIEDVSDIKNINFYHRLCENIRLKINEKESRIVEEKGYIKICNIENNFEKYKNIFFMINDTFIWFDDKKMQSDIYLLSEIGCMINVIGFEMNCKNNKNKVLKAIAIYIE